MQDLISLTGQITTPNARKYMTQLCKHFGHKVPAEIDGDQGLVHFLRGDARLVASDHLLTATLSADNADAIAGLRDVIDDHLKRFAFREQIKGLDWPDQTQG